MFLRTPTSDPSHESELKDVIRTALPNVDEETYRIVVAVAGLLGSVSYADREFSEDERRLVTESLQTIHGVGPQQADAIVSVLSDRIVHISTVEAPRHARTLLELGDRALRLHVLEMLIDVAASDHALSHTEVVFLRQITKSLGLSQADYNELQGRHRDKLSVLK